MMDYGRSQWVTPRHRVGTIIHVAINGGNAEHIVISDMIKDDSKTAIDQPKAVGVDKTVIAYRRQRRWV